jgi:hypothetical protein
MQANLPTLLADASLSNEARRHMKEHFEAPLFLTELLPQEHRHEFEDSQGRITLAYQLVEVHVCAAAAVFVGNMLTPYAQHVCYERDGVLAGPNNAVMPAARKECVDLYSRDEATIKASKVGRGWF